MTARCGGFQDVVELSASSRSVIDRFMIWRDATCNDATWQRASCRVESLTYPLFVFMCSTRCRSGYCDWGFR
jgi:hypothetical protein